MSEITLWGRTSSSNVRKVLWALTELGLDFRRVDAGGAFGVVRDAEYLRLNPNGLVPCLQQGDFVLWESNAIVRYLADVYGQGSLLPDGAQARAAADKWMDWASTAFAGPFRDIFWNSVRATPAQRSETEIQRGWEQGAALLQIADAALARQPYLSGERFGMGDIPLATLLQALRTLPDAFPALPHLDAWYGRLQARKGMQLLESLSLR